MSETLSEAISADHHQFDVCADAIRQATDEADKVKWRNQLTWTIARHAISEELTYYPAMEKHLGQQGADLAREDKEQHQEVKDTLVRLQDMSPGDSEFSGLLEQLMDTLHHHIEHEANEDMPRLEGILSREESQDLARSFQRTKAITPTKSHPSAPTSYYLENLAALLAAPLDRFQDLVTGRQYPDQQEVEARA